MIVWNGLERYPENSPPSVVSVGNYDGVHVGHQAILASLRAAARWRNLNSLVITFDPHPLSIVAPARRPRLLQTRRQKLDALEDAGVKGVLILRFDPALSDLSGEQFFRSHLLGRIRAAAIHVGENFRFGHDRAGNLDLLCRLGAEAGTEVIGISQVAVGGDPVSSSAIRSAVERGEVERARRMLGRPLALTGEVVRGDGRGRALAFPTANLDVENEMIPLRGVYVTESVILSTRHPSVTNVGVRPTFGEDRLVVETHLIDFDEDLVGERIEVRFHARLRGEVRFAGAEELADQIARDCAAATSYFESGGVASR